MCYQVPNETINLRKKMSTGNKESWAIFKSILFRWQFLGRHICIIHYYHDRRAYQYYS